VGVTEAELLTHLRSTTHRPAFICQHLQFGENVGFNEDDEPFDPEWPFRNAWCDECDKVLLQQGAWNDVSAGFAGIMVICEGCLEEIAGRNRASK
jgi:hypothetical protein